MLSSEISHCQILLSLCYQCENLLAIRGNGCSVQQYSAMKIHELWTGPAPSLQASDRGSSFNTYSSPPFPVTTTKFPTRHKIWKLEGEYVQIQCCQKLQQHVNKMHDKIKSWNLLYTPHNISNIKKKRSSRPFTGLEWPRGFQEVKVPRFHDNGTQWW